MSSSSSSSSTVPTSTTTGQQNYSKVDVVVVVNITPSEAILSEQKCWSQYYNTIICLFVVKVGPLENTAIVLLYLMTTIYIVLLS